MSDIMLDSETLGTRPGCVVLSIGAVAFGPKGLLDDGFYIVVNRHSCEVLGLHTAKSTLDWWSQQSREAQQVLLEADLPDRSHNLTEALAKFDEYVEKHGGKQVRMWGNGADFDNPIIGECYHAAGKPPRWGTYNNRCYRTLKNLLPTVRYKREGTHHNALDDAKTQALHAVDLLNTLNAWET